MDIVQTLLPDMSAFIRHAKFKCRLATLLLSVALLSGAAWTWAGQNAIAVIYPDIGEPYRDVFEEIIKGIDARIGTAVATYPVSDNTDSDVLKSSLLRQNTKVVVALGRQGMTAASELNKDISVVVGGVMTVSVNEALGKAVVSLSPDPALLFARMKALMPGTKRIFVVYDPDFSGWLMKLAKEAASAQGLELVVYEAQDTRSAVRFYQKIFSEADSDNDALWLPQDPVTVEESSILPLVLQESWNQGIAIFSSNFSYVRRGILFSLYPDNVALGKRLAGLAQKILISGNYTGHGIMPLRDVEGAVNLRTAKHLGLNPDSQAGFDMTFPEQ